MAANAQELKKNVELTLAQLNFTRRLLIKMLLENEGQLLTMENLQYNNISVDKIVRIMRAKGILDGFLVNKNFSVNIDFTLEIIEQLKQICHYIDLNPTSSSSKVHTLLLNALAILEFNPKEGTPLQQKCFEFIRLLTMRRFDSIIHSEIWTYLQKFNLSNVTTDCVKYANKFFDAFDSQLASFCKILAGHKLSEAEIKSLSELRIPLTYLQCSGDQEIANSTGMFEQLMDLIRNPKPLILSEKNSDKKKDAKNNSNVVFQINQNNRNNGELKVDGDLPPPPSYEETMRMDEENNNSNNNSSNCNSNNNNNNNVINHQNGNDGTSNHSLNNYEDQIALAIALSLSETQRSPAKK